MASKLRLSSKIAFLISLNFEAVFRESYAFWLRDVPTPYQIFRGIFCAQNFWFFIKLTLSLLVFFDPTGKGQKIELKLICELSEYVCFTLKNLIFVTSLMLAILVTLTQTLRKSFLKISWRLNG